MGSAVMLVTELRRHIFSVVLQQIECKLFLCVTGLSFFVNPFMPVNNKTTYGYYSSILCSNDASE